MPKLEKELSQNREQSFKLNELRFMEESTTSSSFFSFPLKLAQQPSIHLLTWTGSHDWGMAGRALSASSLYPYTFLT